MSGKSDALEVAILDAVLRNDYTALTALGGTNGFFSLHSADPTEAGAQNSNELSYTGYGRVSQARAGAWTSSGSTRTNTAAVTWGTCTAGSGTATHWAYGTTVSGATTILYFGALTSSLAISTSSNATPQAAIGALSVSED